MRPNLILCVDAISKGKKSLKPNACLFFNFQIRRMQEMLTQMQEKLKASDKKHDSIIDV